MADYVATILLIRTESRRLYCLSTPLAFRSGASFESWWIRWSRERLPGDGLHRRGEDPRKLSSVSSRLYFRTPESSDILGAFESADAKIRNRVR